MGKSKQHRRFQQLELFPELYPPKEEYNPDTTGMTGHDHGMVWKHDMGGSYLEPSGLYPWHENEDDGEEDVVQEWPGLDAINKEWV